MRALFYVFYLLAFDLNYFLVALENGLKGKRFNKCHIGRKQ